MRISSTFQHSCAGKRTELSLAENAHAKAAALAWALFFYKLLSDLGYLALRQAVW
jgi:hypothetical protein